MSMNNRTLRLLLDTAQSHCFDPAIIESEFRHRLELGKIVKHSRKAMTNEEVRSFVIHILEGGQSGIGTKTAALRFLRDSGMACEQRRFGRLWDEARRPISGPWQ